MRVPVVAVVFLLAGCSLFGPEPKPQGTVPVVVEAWTQPGATDEQALSDADSCREQANAVVRQDAAISADIQSSEELGGLQQEAPELAAGMSEYASRQRYRRIFEECMRARGYVSEEE